MDDTTGGWSGGHDEDQLRKALMGIVTDAQRVAVVGDAPQVLMTVLAECDRPTWSLQPRRVGDTDGAFDLVVTCRIDTGLAATVELLEDSGRLLVLVPHARHGARRLAALTDAWTGEDGSTPEELIDVLGAAGLRTEDLAATVVDPATLATDVPDAFVQWARACQDAYLAHLVVVARRGAPAPVPPMLRTLAPLPPVATAFGSARVLGDTGELLRVNADLRERILTLRDHAVGAEAELGHARREVALAKRELALANQLINEQRHDLTAIRASASWRIGQTVVRPVKWARRRPSDARDDG